MEETTLLRNQEAFFCLSGSSQIGCWLHFLNKSVFEFWKVRKPVSNRHILLLLHSWIAGRCKFVFSSTCWEPFLSLQDRSVCSVRLVIKSLYFTGMITVFGLLQYIKVIQLNSSWPLRIQSLTVGQCNLCCSQISIFSHFTSVNDWAYRISMVTKPSFNFKMFKTHKNL